MKNGKREIQYGLHTYPKDEMHCDIYVRNTRLVVRYPVLILTKVLPDFLARNIYAMKISALLLIIQFTSISAEGQNDCIPYYRELSIAEYENHKGLTSEALHRFEQANMDYRECLEGVPKFDFIKMYLNVSDTSSAYELLMKELEKGYKLEKLIYIGISPEKLGDYYLDLKQKEDSLHGVFHGSLDHDLLFFIRDLYAMDQGVLEISSISDSLKTSIRNQVFKKNIQVMAEFCENNGAIGYAEIGHYHHMVNLILLHHRVDDVNDIQNVDLLIKYYGIGIQEGKVSPGVILNLIDNMADIVDKKMPQKTGRYIDPKSGQFKLFENIENVDSLRLSYGLNTLKEISEMMDISLPIQYKLK